MNDPCDEIPKNYSKGLRQRFYTLWANRGHERLQKQERIKLACQKLAGRRNAGNLNCAN
jgi:hypothetical protein